jgi:hypothetical protein
MRRRHHCEHVAFEYRKATLPADCPSLLQHFERIVPCAVQDVGEPEAAVGVGSAYLAAHPLGVVHRFSAVRQRRRRLTHDLAASDVESVREVERLQLLRRARELDDAVEFGGALTGTPRKAQGKAMVTRKAEARAKPDSIGAEAEISMSELKTLLGIGKALP